MKHLYLSVIACGLLVGCEKDEIRSYQVPHVEPKTKAAGAAATKPFQYTMPGGWTESRAEMSVASFRVIKGDQSAQVTVTPLPGRAGGILENVKRWRTQVGLEPVSDEALQKDLQKIDVAGV